MLRNFSIFDVSHLLWDERLNTHHYHSRHLKSLHTIRKDIPNTIASNSGFELHVSAFGSCKKTSKRFCFKKKLEAKVSCRSQLQRAEAYVVQGFVVQEERLIGILHQLMKAEDCLRQAVHISYHLAKAC